MLTDNILNSLITNSNFFRIVFPFLKKEYFSDKIDILVFLKIKAHYEKYNKIPHFSDLKLVIDTDFNITIEDTEELNKKIDLLKKVEVCSNETLLIDETEKWVRDRAIEIATRDFVESFEKDDQQKGSKIEKIKEALGIEFVISIGHDYFKDAKDRMKSYEEIEDKIPLDIDVINKAMGGGLVRKAIFFYMGSTNVGKTVWMCHSTASLVKSGYNVLYLSGEMSTKEINKRIDANLLQIDINELNPKLDKSKFKSKFKDLVNKTHGELIVKEFAAGSLNAFHIRNLLHEIKLKKGFVPDVIVLDHITLFSSYRLPASQTGSYIYYQCVVEEIRAIGIEFNCALLSGCQLNRGAKGKKQDVTNEDVALAYAISQTADWSGAILQTSELKEQLKYLLKVLKTRFASNNDSIHTIGVSYNTMTLKNLNEDEQELPIYIKDQLKVQQSKKDEKEEKVILFDFSN